MQTQGERKEVKQGSESESAFSQDRWMTHVHTGRSKPPYALNKSCFFFFIFVTELLSFNLVLIWCRAEPSLQEARGKGVGIQESSKIHLLWAQHNDLSKVNAHPKSGRASLPTFKPFIVLLIMTLVTVLEILQ